MKKLFALYLICLGLSPVYSEDSEPAHAGIAQTVLGHFRDSSRKDSLDEEFISNFRQLKISKDHENPSQLYLTLETVSDRDRQKLTIRILADTSGKTISEKRLPKPYSMNPGQWQGVDPIDLVIRVLQYLSEPSIQSSAYLPFARSLSRLTIRPDTNETGKAIAVVEMFCAENANVLQLVINRNGGVISAESCDLYLKSNQGKLYLALKLIDDRSEWLRVSELLREILSSTDLSDPFIRKQINLAKEEIDHELFKNIFRKRVIDFPFVVAKLRLMEAMMANHARLNVSYDREVLLIKGLLQSYFFPGQEEDGEIIFPDEEEYAFTLYGYLKERVLETETAPSGVIDDDPRFPSKTMKWGGEIPEPPNEPKDREEPAVKKEGDEKGKRVSRAMSPEDLEKNIEFIKKMANDSKNTFGYLSDFVNEGFPVIRQINQYEPWAMLLQAVSDPSSLEDDLQLSDFFRGVKLKFKLSNLPSHTAEEQQGLLKFLNDEADFGLQFQEEIDARKGQAALYVYSSITGPAAIHFRYLLYLKKMIEFEQSNAGLTAAKGLIWAAKWLEKLPVGASWYGKVVMKVPSLFGHCVLGGKNLMRIALENKRVEKFLRLGTKNNRYFKTGMAVVLASDVTEAVVNYFTSIDSYESFEAWQAAGSRLAGDLLYLMPYLSPDQLPPGSWREWAKTLPDGMAQRLNRRAAWIYEEAKEVEIQKIVREQRQLAEKEKRVLSLEDLEKIRKSETTVTAAEAAAKEETAFRMGKLRNSYKATWRWNRFWGMVGWGVFWLDFGNFWAPDTVPSSADLIRVVFGEWVPDGISRAWTGTTLKDQLVEEYEGRLGIYRGKQWQTAVDTFRRAIELSEDESHLTVSKVALEKSIREYANQRLFLIYYLIQRWNNQTVTAIGNAEQAYWAEYEDYEKEMVEANDLYKQKLKSFSATSSANEERKDKEREKNRKK